MRRFLKSIISIFIIIVLLCFGMVESFAAVTSDLLGDVNMDQKISISDATAVQQYLALMIGESDLSLQNADINQDKTVNIVDVSGIQLYVAKVISDFSELVVEEGKNETEEVKVTEYTEDGIKYKKETDSYGTSTVYMWIVDELAQRILEPIYETKIYCTCNICGADVSGDENGRVGDFDPEFADMYFAQYHWHVQHCSSAWHSEGVATLVGYNETFIPEKGHWEKVK